ncbi:unnamed protein product, partial [marine sediment metagenome]
DGSSSPSHVNSPCETDDDCACNTCTCGCVLKEYKDNPCCLCLPQPCETGEERCTCVNGICQSVPNIIPSSIEVGYNEEFDLVKGQTAIIEDGQQHLKLKEIMFVCECRLSSGEVEKKEVSDISIVDTANCDCYTKAKILYIDEPIVAYKIERESGVYWIKEGETMKFENSKVKFIQYIPLYGGYKARFIVYPKEAECYQDRDCKLIFDMCSCEYKCIPKNFAIACLNKEDKFCTMEVKPVPKCECINNKYVTIFEVRRIEIIENVTQQVEPIITGRVIEEIEKECGGCILE